MGNIVGKPFGVVASINYEAALEESVKEGNQAKFYLASQRDAGLDSIDPSDEFNTKRRNALIINGNKIQGISEEDSVKLDELSHVTKIFQYKGSVLDGDTLLKKVPPEASVGDVWNVEKECEIGGVKYPAHTNFVCSSAKASIGGKPASSTWDSLGGTMQMGTQCEGQYTKKEVFFTQIDNIPISNFWLELSSNSALEFDTSSSEPKLTLNLKEAIVNNDSSTNTITCSNQAGSIMNQFSIKLGSGICLNNNMMLRLSTKFDNDSSELYDWVNSGLTFDNDGAVHIAIAEADAKNANMIQYALNIKQNDEKRGGLYIDGTQVFRWLQNNKLFNDYIKSLITEKLEAQ